MIVFDLRCAPSGHVFEAWFGSSNDYEDQRSRGLLHCPLCGAAAIEKAATAARLNRRCGAASEAGDDGANKRTLAALAAAQRAMLETSEYVGTRFADEARAIHLGEADARSIHGEATRLDARALVEEGIKVAPLPFPVVQPGDEN